MVASAGSESITFHILGDLWKVDESGFDLICIDLLHLPQRSVFKRLNIQLFKVQIRPKSCLTTCYLHEEPASRMLLYRFWNIQRTKNKQRYDPKSRAQLGSLEYVFSDFLCHPFVFDHSAPPQKSTVAETIDTCSCCLCVFFGTRPLQSVTQVV